MNGVDKNMWSTAFAVIATGFLWGGSSLLYQWSVPFTSVSVGVDWFYIPSGIRTLAFLIGGVWAAAGIALTNLILVPQQFGATSNALIVALAFGTSAIAYIGVVLTMWMLNVDLNLKSLTPGKLPLICLGAAISSSLGHSAFLASLGLKPWAVVPRDTLAMITGDFTGSLLVVGAIYALIKLWRRLARHRQR